MSRVKELAAKVAECESLDFNDKKNGYILEIVYPKSQDELVEAANKDFTAAWDVLRNGTDNEFSGLINLISCGMNQKEFASDKSLREIMRIGKRRMRTAQNKEDFLCALKIGFGNLFDKFWNETDGISPVAKPRASGETAVRRTQL